MVTAHRSWQKSVLVDEISMQTYRKLFNVLQVKAIYIEVLHEVGNFSNTKCCGCHTDRHYERQHDCF